MQMLKFTQFVNEAQIKDKVLVSKLDRIHEIKERLKELTAETKSIEGELKEFDASIKPVFDAMKVLNDKLALTEKYVVKITRYGGEGTAISYGKAVEQALTQVDEAAQAIINECVRVNTAVTSVKHSYDIQKVDESKLSDKVKAVIAKFSAKIKSAVEKFKSVFATKTAKIDQANQKLASIKPNTKVNENDSEIHQVHRGMHSARLAGNANKLIGHFQSAEGRELLSMFAAMSPEEQEHFLKLAARTKGARDKDMDAAFPPTERELDRRAQGFTAHYGKSLNTNNNLK